jgi:tetratricopeptide (TPR) repeat protein
MPTYLSSLGRIVALACALGMAVPAIAQSPSGSDLQALRFYLDQGNDLAVSAELRRLQAQFPDWTPPSDISQLQDTGGPTSIDQIYRLIEAGDFDAARDLIAQTDREFAEWSPPADMMDLLALSEGQADFTAAVEAGQAVAAIGIIRANPALLACERVNNAWELADIYLTQGNTVQALSIFRSVLRSCADRGIVVATLEKADAVSSLDELAALSDLAQSQHADIAALIRQTEDRLRAGRQEPARWGNDQQVIALEDAPVPQTAQQAPPARPASPQPAPTAATPAAPSAPAQPAAHSGGQNAIERAAQRGAWAECLALSANSSNVNIVFQRGWCAYNAERAMEAITAFRDVAQRSGSASVRRDAAYGWMLSLLKLNMTEQAAQLAAGVDLTRDQRIEVEGQILDQRGVRAYENRDYASAIAFFDAHERLTGYMRRDLALLRGYALLNQGNRAAARDIFMTLHRQLSTRETRNALAALD